MSGPRDTGATHRAIEAIWRIEQAAVVAKLARMLRGDVGTAEELAQDALVAALEDWPAHGVPANPGAWLMATGKRRAIDRLRHHKMAEREIDALGHDLDALGASVEPDFADALIDAMDDAKFGNYGDDLLRLIFTACHPVLSKEARVALTLRLLCGLSIDEIARAFLAPVPTIQQRIVRAKRALAEARVPYEVPHGAERDARLASVLEVIYLVFNEGYAATAGDDWMRPALVDDALRLGRVLVGLAPHEAEVHALVALMEIQASRMAARTAANGEPILLLEQNRARWDPLLIRRGLAALERAQQLADADSLGPYALQAAIAACHARALTAEATDWARIAALYDALAQVLPSPIVELNRAVAVAMAYGADEGLAIVDALQAEGTLDGYHLLPSVRADLLAKLGRHDEARAEWLRAAGMARNAREKALLTKRAAGSVH